MSSDEETYKPIHFRPSKEVADIIKTYMGIHNCNKTEAIEKIFQEWEQLKCQQLKQKTDTVSDFIPECLKSFPAKSPVVKDYLQMRAREQLKTEFLEDRQKIRTSHELEREQLISEIRQKRRNSGESYRGAKIFGFIEGERDCPKHWNASQCLNQPCDRRFQCRQEGRLPGRLG